MPQNTVNKAPQVVVKIDNDFLNGKNRSCSVTNRGLRRAVEATRERLLERCETHRDDLGRCVATLGVINGVALKIDCVLSHETNTVGPTVSSSIFDLTCHAERRAAAQAFQVYLGMRERELSRLKPATDGTASGVDNVKRRRNNAIAKQYDDCMTAVDEWIKFLPSIDEMCHSMEMAVRGLGKGAINAPSITEVFCDLVSREASKEERDNALIEYILNYALNHARVSFEADKAFLDEVFPILQKNPPAGREVKDRIKTAINTGVINPNGLKIMVSDNETTLKVTSGWKEMGAFQLVGKKVGGKRPSFPFVSSRLSFERPGFSEDALRNQLNA